MRSNMSVNTNRPLPPLPSSAGKTATPAKRGTISQRAVSWLKSAPPLGSHVLAKALAHANSHYAKVQEPIYQEVKSSGQKPSTAPHEDYVEMTGTHKDYVEMTGTHKDYVDMTGARIKTMWT